MKDLLNIEVNIGDKVAFIPSKKCTPYEMQYGIVEKLTKDNTAAWCKSLNNDYPPIIRWQHQLIKLN